MRVFRSAAAFLIATAAVMVPSVALAPVASADCPDIEVIFARGTGEPPGIGEVGQAFVDSLRGQVHGRSVGVFGVNYPANRLFIGAHEGAVDVNNRVQYLANTCPGTRVVLGGFSQGAAVVDIAAGVPVAGINLGAPMPPQLADRVAAVAVFGNPSNRVGGPITSLSPNLGYKAIDLCNGGDPICSNGRNVSAHSNYVASGMTSQAASFVAGRV